MQTALLRRLVLAALITSWAAGSALAQSTTVIVVRHAEKIDDSADPLLSEPGRARAEALADALADAGVSTLITTQYQRTRLTAAPLAERLGVAPTLVAASGRSHVEDVAARVRELANGGTIVVVGHSNTVPAIIRALGGPDVGGIDDAEYDHLFILTLSDSGVRLIRSRYGR
ncbi:MAG: histidine phosphatase family protein [Longimicrobiales bacterium]